VGSEIPKINYEIFFIVLFPDWKFQLITFGRSWMAIRFLKYCKLIVLS
jgi:hypothetical protein